MQRMLLIAMGVGGWTLLAASGAPAAEAGEFARPGDHAASHIPAPPNAIAAETPPAYAPLPPVLSEQKTEMSLDAAKVGLMAGPVWGGPAQGPGRPLPGLMRRRCCDGPPACIPEYLYHPYHRDRALYYGTYAADDDWFNGMYDSYHDYQKSAPLGAAAAISWIDWHERNAGPTAWFGPAAKKRPN